MKRKPNQDAVTNLPNDLYVGSSKDVRGYKVRFQKERLAAIKTPSNLFPFLTEAPLDALFVNKIHSSFAALSTSGKPFFSKKLSILNGSFFNLLAALASGPMV